MSKQSEQFGRLLKAGIGSIAMIEGKKSPIVEAELGDTLCVSGATIQRYKSGAIPPEADAIKILAQACVTRGRHNRVWAKEFLEAGRYPAIRKLLDELCPEGKVTDERPRVYHNLPSPTYSRFIMREEPFADLQEGIAQLLPVILIHSFGGMGKSSLALEYCRWAVQARKEAQIFDAVVWVSDKHQDGRSNLTVILDTIARTLDYDGVRNLASDEKKHAIEQLLRNHRVLLIVDNFETVTDAEVLPWLLNRVPENSKVIITSRANVTRSLRRRVWPVDLLGMTKDEADAFVRQHLRQLKIESLLASQVDLTHLLDLTGGNPFAIEAVLGYMKHEKRPLQEVINEIQSMRGEVFDELFDELFKRSWRLLGAEARNVAMALSFFHKCAAVSALSAIADVPGTDEKGLPLRGSALEEAIDLLEDLKLLHLERSDDQSQPPRYAQHPLVRSFIKKIVQEDTTRFEMGARERWISWYRKFANDIGFCWNDIGRLRALDIEGEQDAIEAAVTWVFERGRYNEVIHIARDVRYYHYVRGNWSIEKSLNVVWAEAAQKAGNEKEEFDALVYHINVASKQGDLIEVEKHLPRLEELMARSAISQEQLIGFRHAKALYYLERKDFDQALQLWEENRSQSNLMAPQVLNANLRWTAVCLYSMGQLERAKELFQQMLADSHRHNFIRGSLAANIKLAAIALDQGDVGKAEEILNVAVELADTMGDRMLRGEALAVYARLQDALDNSQAALSALQTAIDLFTRLGSKKRLANAREYLKQITAT